MGHININSIRNTLDMLSSLIAGRLDILMIGETKIDTSSSTNQFLMHGYSTIYRFDRNDNKGGNMLFVKDNLTTFLGRCRSLLYRIEPQKEKMACMLLLQSSYKIYKKPPRRT